MKKGLLGLALAGLTLASACSSGQTIDTSHTITVLAGSELKDLVPLLPDIKKATGCAFHVSEKLKPIAV